MEYAYKPTTNGLKVLIACMDTGGVLQITRVEVGKGRVSEDTDLADQHELIDYVADGAISDRRHDGDRLYLTVQYSNREHSEIPTFYLSEFIIYVLDPDTGEETDLLYATLGDYPQPVPAYRQDYPDTVCNFPLVMVLSDEINVSIDAPVGLVTYDELIDLVSRVDITIPITGWEATNDASGYYDYFCDIPVEGIKNRMVPLITIMPESFNSAGECELANYAQAILGFLKVYAKTIPTAEIHASLLLISNPPYIRGSGGGGDEVQAGVGLSRSLDGKLNINLGDGVSVDSHNNLQVDRETVLTGADMVDEAAAEQEIRDILLNENSGENTENNTEEENNADENTDENAIEQGE